MRHRVPLIAAALTLTLTVLALGPAKAQVEVGKRFVGTWEGQIDFRGLRGDPTRDPGRTLVIDSVAERDGKLVPSGRFGITGKGSGSITDASIDPTGPQPSLAFTSAVGLRVRMQLAAADRLDGTIQVPGAGLQGTDRPIKLTRKP